MINIKEKIIFLGICRTASSSIYQALSKNGLVKNKSKKHQTIKNIQKKFPNINLDEYLKFTFVRNPYDRWVSLYNWSRKHKAIQKKDSLLDFVRKGVEGKYKKHPRYRYMPQGDWITDFDGNIPVDFIGRFENLQKDFDYICKEIGHKMKLGRINVSTPYATRENCCPKTKTLIRKYHAKDFDLFGYQT